MNHPINGGNKVQVLFAEKEPGGTLDVERRFIPEYDEEVVEW